MEFVTFEIAKKLKEKGFIGNVEIGEYCGYYYKDEGIVDLYYDASDNSDLASDEYLRPTISQVLKWLREEKKIHICVSYSDNIGAMWEYEAILLEGALCQNAGSAYVSYEQAALAGIEYVLDKK